MKFISNQKIKFILFSISLLFISCSDKKSSEINLSLVDLPVSLLIGQSNADGQGVLSEIPYQYQNFNGSMICGVGTNDSFEQLDPGVNSTFGSPSGRYGIEVSYLRKMRKTCGTAYMIKWSRGGTGFCPQSSPNDWDVDTEGELYDLTKATLDSCLVGLEDKGILPIVDEVIWIQGTKDSQSETCAFEYEQNLTDLINGIRAHLGYDVLWKITLLPDYHPSQFVPETNQAKINISYVLPNIEIYNTDLITVESDSVHFDSHGLIELGVNLATSVKAAKKDIGNACLSE